MRPALRNLFVEYQAYHGNPVNVAIHKVAVPAILFHIVVMLDWVGTGLRFGGVELTLGMTLCALAGIWEAVEEVATPRTASTNRLAALSKPPNGATMRGSRRHARRSMETNREAATSSTASWYVAMSPRHALVPFAIASLWLGRHVPAAAVVAVAVLAWGAQLIGHVRFERRAPAFTENLVQVLVGPVYVAALLLGDWPEQDGPPEAAATRES